MGIHSRTLVFDNKDEEEEVMDIHNRTLIFDTMDEEDQDMGFLRTSSQQAEEEQDIDQPHSVVASLKACTQQKDLLRGIRIHAVIVRTGLLETNVFVGNTLVNMYAKCGSLAKALEVFDRLPFKDVVSWSVLIAGYVQHGYGEKALKCYEDMQQEGFSPNSITFICILKACGSIRAAEKGKEIHAEIVKDGLFEKDVVVGTAVVDMYAKCGLLAKAEEVFDNLPVRNVVSWNALMAGYAQHGHNDEALKCFEMMQLLGLSPTGGTFACILKACGNLGATDKGQEIHAEIVRGSLLEKDNVIGTALVDMYAKCGLLAQAHEVFDKLPDQNVISWTALIGGYAQHGHCEQALKCFECMQLEGLSPNAVTFACILKACGCMGAVDKGEEIHAEIVREGLLEKNIVIGTALVDMYVKCGLLEKAQQLFDKLPNRTVVLWNALMAGYALLGKAKYVFYSFDRMIGEGIKPNLITFTIVLNACSYTGLLDKGQMYFEIMSTSYGVIPNLEHHTCMVDLFARAGHLDKAVEVIKAMPVPADRLVWLTMLSACRRWGNMKLGRLAFEHAVQLDEKETAAYICMSNIYADAGRPADVDCVEVSRLINKTYKKPGYFGWTDAGGLIQSFASGEQNQSLGRAFHLKLESLVCNQSQDGHFPTLQHWDVLYMHHKKLATAYDFIRRHKKMNIHIFKDMQSWGNCCSATLVI